MRTQAQRRCLIQRYKAKVGCARCSERHPACLDLHHREPVSKSKKLTETKGSGRKYTGGSAWDDLSYAEIVREIQMCDVLCSNCHRKENSEQLKWRSLVRSEKPSKGLLAAEAALGLEA